MKKKIILLTLLISVLTCSRIMAAPNFNMQALLTPAFYKNTDAWGVHRQLQLAMMYGDLTEGQFNHIYADYNSKIPVEAVTMLFNDNLITSYTYKTIAGQLLNEADVMCIYDSTYYLANNPDLVDTENLLEHFLTVGMSQGRVASPLFNVNTYINNNPDLVAIYGTDLKQYYTHYMLFGRFEGRKGI